MIDAFLQSSLFLFWLSRKSDFSSSLCMNPGVEMNWYLRRVEDRWELWDEDEKQEIRSLAFLPARLTVPQCFSTLEEWEKWLYAEEKKQAKKKVLNLLAGRNYPSHALRRKLLLKGFSDRMSREIVEWVQQLGYVQDSEYLRAVIRQYQERGHGPKTILWKLRAKGFSEVEVAQEIKQMLPLDMQKDTIRKVIAKRRLSTEPSARQKTVMALLRRGFNIAIINEVLFKTPPNRDIEEME